jgi:DNA polymerase elongation subunit (family B)
MQIDYVKYIDTDSLFVGLSEFFHAHGIGEHFESLDDGGKIDMIKEASKILETYINDRIHNETRALDYNSQVDDFKILFKQEIIAKTALFVKKKKYAYWMLDDEGVPCDTLSVTGLEIVRSDSAEAVRTRLKDVYEMIMKRADEDELLVKIQKYRNELKEVAPEEIAGNVSVNNIDKYIGGGEVIKHTPWHVRGVHNYRKLITELDLVNQYEDIHEGNKAKVVYLKPNIFDIDVLTFIRWPKEFNQYLTIDYDAMIDKFFLKKIGFLLSPMNRMDLLATTKSSMALGGFFE